MEKEPTSWTDLIKKSVHTSDDVDIGDIEAVNRHFLVVKRGLLKVHRYYIPLVRVEGWDGRVVWLKITEEQVKSKYQKDSPPDPHYYHYSDTPLPDEDVVREFLINMPKIPAKYYEERPFSVDIADSSPSSSSSTSSHKENFRCDLCGATFGTEDELDRHVMGH